MGADADADADTDTAGALAVGAGLETGAAFASPPSVFEAHPKKMGSKATHPVTIPTIFNRNETGLIEEGTFA